MGKREELRQRQKGKQSDKSSEAAAATAATAATAAAKNKATASDQQRAKGTTTTATADLVIEHPDSSLTFLKGLAIAVMMGLVLLSNAPYVHPPSPSPPPAQDTVHQHDAHPPSAPLPESTPALAARALVTLKHPITDRLTDDLTNSSDELQAEVALVTAALTAAVNWVETSALHTKHSSPSLRQVWLLSETLETLFLAYRWPHDESLKARARLLARGLVLTLGSTAADPGLSDAPASTTAPAGFATVVSQTKPEKLFHRNRLPCLRVLLFAARFGFGSGLTTSASVDNAGYIDDVDDAAAARLVVAYRDSVLPRLVEHFSAHPLRDVGQALELAWLFEELKVRQHPAQCMPKLYETSLVRSWQFTDWFQKAESSPHMLTHEVASLAKRGLREIPFGSSSVRQHTERLVKELSDWVLVPPPPPKQHPRRSNAGDGGDGSNGDSNDTKSKVRRLDLLCELLVSLEYLFLGQTERAVSIRNTVAAMQRTDGAFAPAVPAQPDTDTLVHTTMVCAWGLVVSSTAPRARLH
eukprot:m.489726 g.489726  ORF g.489726 m.489726 type:complete len:527 (+) comp27051_c0_seq1:166-1746(+)